MHIYNTKFISYRHPFITFETTVSEGSYIRSFAQILLEKLNSIGTLSYLERINEGAFFFDNEKELDPLDYIDLPINHYKGTVDWLDKGKKISLEYLETKEDGKYLIITDDFFSIIEIQNEEVIYLLNKVNRI
jgi:tRNA pseudouridine55 synthase